MTKLKFLVLEVKKVESENKPKYDTFYSNSKSETVINGVFGSIYTTIISNIQKPLEKGSGWIIDSIIDHDINISKYNS